MIYDYVHMEFGVWLYVWCLTTFFNFYHLLYNRLYIFPAAALLAAVYSPFDTDLMYALYTPAAATDVVLCI